MVCPARKLALGFTRSMNSVSFQSAQLENRQTGASSCRETWGQLFQLESSSSKPRAAPLGAAAGGVGDGSGAEGCALAAGGSAGGGFVSWLEQPLEQHKTNNESPSRTRPFLTSTAFAC
jgi:hypothetical protein